MHDFFTIRIEVFRADSNLGETDLAAASMGSGSQGFLPEGFTKLIGHPVAEIIIDGFHHRFGVPHQGLELYHPVPMRRCRRVDPLRKFPMMKRGFTISCFKYPR